jgi:hypothetical protein
MENLNKHTKYVPIDPEYRHGFKAQIYKIAMDKASKKRMVHYFCGGQPFCEPSEEFIKKYKSMKN